LKSGLKNVVAVWLKEKEAVFLDSGFVSAQSQVTADMFLRQSLARIQKFSSQTATTFFKTL